MVTSSISSAPEAVGTPSLPMARIWAGCPPVAEGVMVLKKNPVQE